MSTEILPGVSKLAGSEKELEVVDFSRVSHCTKHTKLSFIYFILCTLTHF